MMCSNAYTHTYQTLPLLCARQVIKDNESDCSDRLSADIQISKWIRSKSISIESWVLEGLATLRLERAFFCIDGSVKCEREICDRSHRMNTKSNGSHNRLHVHHVEPYMLFICILYVGNQISTYTNAEKSK